MPIELGNLRIFLSTVSAIIKETCIALNKALAHYLIPPSTAEEWKKISDGFLRDWNFPNCVGSFDGKHVPIQAPPNTGSSFFNYKKYFSIVLMAACDSNYRFTFIDVGANGSLSDGSIFASSEIGHAIKHRQLNVPDGQVQLPGSNEATSYCFIGDQAFPLMTNFLRPYPGRRLGKKLEIFNYRLSSARRTIENAFGILSARWRIYQRPITLDVEAVDKIVISTICLHNFLKARDDEEPSEGRVYCPPGFIDSELRDGQVIHGRWRNEQSEQT